MFLGQLLAISDPQKDPDFAGHVGHGVDDLAPELLQEAVHGAHHVDNERTPPAGADLNVLHGFDELFWENRFDRQPYAKIGFADHGPSVPGTGRLTRAEGP